MAGQNDETAQKHLPVELKRRQFLQGLGFIGAGAGAIFSDRILNANYPAAAAEVPEFSATPIISNNTGEIPRRSLGKTGVAEEAGEAGGEEI